MIIMYLSGVGLHGATALYVCISKYSVMHISRDFDIPWCLYICGYIITCTCYILHCKSKCVMKCVKITHNTLSKCVIGGGWVKKRTCRARVMR